MSQEVYGGKWWGRMLKGTAELKSLANAANWGLCDLASVYPSSSCPLPWATRAFFLFFERASCAGVLGLCTSCFLFAWSALLQELCCLTPYCLSFRPQLGLFWPHNPQKPFSPFLPQCPVLFSWWLFSLNVVQALPVIYPIATSLSFLLRESWFYLGSQRAHPNSHFSWAAFYLDTV